MKLQTVALKDIVSNPWRDEELFPIDPEHVQELRESIGDHGFFGGVKGRRVDGKVELGCGHARIAAARACRLGEVGIYIDDLDDDGMLRLMVDENATQAGSSPGAIVNEVAAITRRLIRGLNERVQPNIAKLFESKAGMDRAISKLRNGDAHMALGFNVIRAYLGQGNPDRAHRSANEIRDAISTLKTSGRYDEIVEAELLKYPPPADDDKPGKGKAIITTKPRERRAPTFDAKCVSLFPTTHQASAFKQAVTTAAALKAIPVSEQYKLAKHIMSSKNTMHAGSQFKRKTVGAPFIKATVQGHVQEALKKQREIDKEERERYLNEQREERIDSELYTAKASLRSLLSALMKLCDLADQFPGHPKISGFSDRLKPLRSAIDQLDSKLDPRKRK